MLDSWDFQDARISRHDDWSSLMFIEVYPNGTFAENVNEDTLSPPLGYIFVIEPARSDPKLKLPGGHKAEGETPFETAIREMHGETGLLAPAKAVRYVDSDRRRDHWSCLYRARVEESEVPWMNSNHDQNEGEVPKFVTKEQFHEALKGGGFLRYHYTRLSEAGLIAG